MDDALFVPNIDGSLYGPLSFIFVCLVFSAVTSAAETSMMACSKPKLHALEKEGNRGARRVMRLTSEPETLLSTILTTNTLVNIMASSVTTGLFLHMFGEKGILYASLIMTFVVLLFSEVLPKTLATRNPEKFAMVLSLPMFGLIKLTRPITWFIRLATQAMMLLMGIRPGETDPNFGEEDVRGAIGLGLHHGVIEKPEHRMLDSILELDDLTVDEVMTHRSSLENINADLPPQALYDKVAASAHSRLPVWKDEPDNIVGIVHVKDFYRAYNAHVASGVPFDLTTVMQEPYFIPESAIVADQLLEFRKKRKHLALVVDEFGDIMGVLTLEDILEEIVGEIEDEHDVHRPLFTREDDGSLVVSGGMAVRDANREFGWNLPDDDAVTLGGLLIEVAQHIPATGEKVTVGGLTFEVMTKRRQAVSRVRVRPEAAPAPQS
jgi:Mg2+/Co2+ transporter CorB